MVVSRIMCHIHMTLKNRIHHFHPFSNQNILRIVPPKRYIPTPAPHLQHSPAVGAPGLEKPSKFRGPDESRKRQPTNHLTLRTGGSHLYFCSKPLRSASWLVGFKSTHWWKMFFSPLRGWIKDEGIQKQPQHQTAGFGLPEKGHRQPATLYMPQLPIFQNHHG